MLRNPNLWRASATLAVCGGLAALPAGANAQNCTVTVTLANGQHETIPVGSAGTSALSGVNGKVVSMSESCQSAPAASPNATPAQTASSTQTATSSTASAPTTSSPRTSTAQTESATATHTTASTPTYSTLFPTATTPKAKPKTKPKAQPKPKPATPAPVKPAPAPKPQPAPAPAPAPSHHSSTHSSAPKPVITPLTNSKGAPTKSNPSASFSLPGAAPIGVPNFFIDDFQIPPFLLPIYQAAGIEYNVPWQVLAAINWIETDYGRNLSISSAGAEGWMQFEPATWKSWGVDATGTGFADPYNPTDAIFTAARYLQAAGASKNLYKAILAYNHADWYARSVLLRAQLIGGMPKDLVGALTGLVEGHFPVAAKASYADDSVVKQAGKKVKGSNAAVPVQSGNATATNIFAKPGSPVIAVNDGKIVKLGTNAKLGKYIVLQDAS
ncbi:MAG: lytic murein transglycosylase, partial [Solirubrobacterales bacterium]|nr:lytic murein transglycosylase [Solirubrobacterales bacterium]